MEILTRGLELIGYGFVFYLTGLITVVPGMVLGRHMERADAPRWPAHLAIMFLGLLVYGVLVGPRLG